MGLRLGIFDGYFGAFVVATLLTDFERDVLWPVVRDDFRVAEAIDEILWTKVVWIAEPFSIADNADMNARCVDFFSRFLCHGFMENRRLSDGTL